MDEFIKRDAVITYLEETAEGLRNTPSWADLAIQLAEGIKENFPAANVVEVVRCKDCKHVDNGYIGKLYCRKYSSQPVSANDYCSWGEPKDSPSDDVVSVVRCKDCLLHGNCTTEDSFILSGLCENKSFCCVGKRKGADNG